MTPHPALPADQLVTSSDLVRHFGLWQERATRAPVYILHRGRPRLVLTSIETMEALCAPHAVATPGEPAPADGIDPGLLAAMLLDGVADLVLVADGDGAILASSRSARAHFGAATAIGAPIGAITPLATRTFLTDAIERVIASGIGDRLEIPSSTRAGRTLTLALEPAGGGVAVFAQDNTVQRDHARATATDRALVEAMLAAGGVASAMLNPRGYIEHPAPTLAALTGLSREALASVRFVALVELAARPTLGAAIEAAMAGESVPPVDARLLVNRADPIAVRVALAPLRRDATVEGVVAVVLQQSTV